MVLSNTTKNHLMSTTIWKESKFHVGFLRAELDFNLLKKSLDLVLTLFLPAMGWINPYTFITWHRPVGIGLSRYGHIGSVTTNLLCFSFYNSEDHMRQSSWSKYWRTNDWVLELENNRMIIAVLTIKYIFSIFFWKTKHFLHQ